MVTRECIRGAELFITQLREKSKVGFGDHDWRVRLWTYQTLAYLNEARFCKERRKWRQDMQSMQHSEIYCIGEAMSAVAKAMAEAQALITQQELDA